MTQRFRIFFTGLVLAFLSLFGAKAEVPLTGDLVVAVFPPDAQAETTPTPVCDDTGLCALFWVGSFFSSHTTTDIFGATIAPHGQLLVHPEILTIKHSATAILAVGLEKGFAVFWDDQFPDGNISPVLQYYDQSLAPQGSAIRLPFKSGIGVAIDDPNRYDGFASVVRTSLGFVFYGSTVNNPRTLAYDVFVYFLDRVGNETRPRVKVNEGRSTDSNAVMFRGLAVQPNGNLLAVYWRGAKDSYDVYLRLLTAKGIPLSPETLVNNERHRSQALPAVATAPDGSFMIVWRSAPGLDTTGGILARRFSARGRPLGIPFQVNNIHNLDQRFPTIAADAKGNFFVAWQSFSPKFDWDVKGRWFRSDGTSVGGRRA